MRTMRHCLQENAIFLVQLKETFLLQKHCILDSGQIREVRTKATAELLAKLKNRKIFLFGTAGFGGSEEYFTNILDNVKKLIDESNTVVGEYMCQGRMPDSVRERYIKMKEQPDHMPNLDMLIENFDKALSHPDAADLDRLQKMVTA